MNVKGEVLLQFFNKSKLRNGTKTFLEPKFFSINVKFKKFRFSATLIPQFFKTSRSSKTKTSKKIVLRLVLRTTSLSQRYNVAKNTNVLNLFCLL